MRSGRMRLNLEASASPTDFTIGLNLRLDLATLKP
jgi:hypothetical protein